MRPMAAAASLPLSAALCAALFPVASAAPLAPHHAVYNLSLGTDKEQTVLAASGTMTYDVTDSCTAWTTSQHLVINLTNKDGQDIHMISDYATLESKDGTHLDFHTKQITDTAVTAQLDGTATLDHLGGKGHADFSTPEKTQVLLPEGTLLPMAHTNALLNAAIAGKRFLSVPLFDGTGADGAQDTFATIESWKPPALQKWAALSGLPFGKVHLAFFDRTEATETPNYEITMQYFANGVADTLGMDFGDFIMDGKLAQLDLRPPAKC